MIALRMADPVITGVIGTWLNAGGMEHGVIARPEARPPQGGPIAPCLAPVSRHDVIDLGCEKRAQKDRPGEASLRRLVDEFGVALQDKRDAEPCDRTRTHRLEKFGRKLAPAKTRRRRFGRFAREHAAS